MWLVGRVPLGDFAVVHLNVVYLDDCCGRCGVAALRRCGVAALRRCGGGAAPVGARVWRGASVGAREGARKCVSFCDF
jgi:hypothetical protein